MKGNGDDEKNPPEAVDDASGLEAVPEREDDVEAVRREAADLREQLLRKRAEFENYRRRTEREREQVSQEKAAQVLKGLIPPIDNLERALAAATELDASAQRTVVDERGGASPRRAEDDPLRQGVELILRELKALLESSGVTVENPVGQPFDPLRHQALSTEEAPGQADGTVLEVFRKGYALKDRLLRPALVKVAQGPGDHESGSRGEKVH